MKSLYILVLSVCSLFISITANADLVQSDVQLMTAEKSWYEIGATSTDKYYINPKAITEIRPLVYSVPAIIHVQSSTNENISDGDVVLIYNVYSCILRKSSIVRYVQFTKDGAYVRDENRSSLKWNTITKNSFDDVILSKLCKTTSV